MRARVYHDEDVHFEDEDCAEDSRPVDSPAPPAPPSAREEESEASDEADDGPCDEPEPAEPSSSEGESPFKYGMEDTRRLHSPSR